LKENVKRAAIELIEAKNFAHIATLRKNGAPHVTPVWVDYDGEFVLVNTLKGRIKERNVARDPRVAIDVMDHNSPYRNVVILGRVVSVTREGADKHIDKLAKKYTGKDKYVGQLGEVRILIKIKPEHWSYYNV